MASAHPSSHHSASSLHQATPEHSRSDIYELPHYAIPHVTPPSPPLPLTLASHVATLATINHSNKLEVREEALEIIAQYAQYETIVCGVYGLSHHMNTSFLKQMALLQDIIYTEDHSEVEESIPSLRINTQPLTLNAQTKVFFLQYCHPCSHSHPP